jgi:2',3'-cyclic-nucleotide 2'-phosphodiesterase/3'-nucleotidase
MDFTLRRRRGRWRVVDRRATTLRTDGLPEDPAVLAAAREQHAATIAFVSQVIATSTVELSTAESRYRATPIIAFVNAVQTDAVAAALDGGPHATLPVLSVTAPFSRTASFPAGKVRIKDVAGLYTHDNPLEAVVLSGAEVRTYLEHSARYFRRLAPGDPVDPDAISDPSLPDYNFDIMSGVDYDIDVSRPVGERITRLTRAGVEVDRVERFVVAVNSYRRSGGGNFPCVVRAPVFRAPQTIRQLLVEWARARGTIDPAEFFRPNWTLVCAGVPVF